MKKIPFLLLACIFVLSAQAQRRTTTTHSAPAKPISDSALLSGLTAAYQPQQLINQGDSLPYRLLLPKDYDKNKSYPLILFLHGAGERGSDNELQLKHGGSLFLDDKIRTEYPAIVVFPQCPANSYWSNVDIERDTVKQLRTFHFKPEGEPTIAMKLAIQLTSQLLNDYPVKKDQVYVMGLSMGGMGTFEIVRRLPKTFAAALPICGGADTTTASALRKTAWWIFHGAKDDIVPPHFSEDMVQALAKFYGVELEYTVYPNSKHDSWNMVFKEPDLFKWMFEQKLQP